MPDDPGGSEGKYQFSLASLAAEADKSVGIKSLTTVKADHLAVGKPQCTLVIYRFSAI